MGLDLYGPHFVTGDSAVAALVRTLNQLVENILAGATPATGSVTDAKVAADAAIAQSKIAGLVAELATKLNAAGIVAKAAATTNQDLNGLDVIDGYQTVAGDQVLLTGQTAPADNGPWIVAAGAWTRPADFAAGSVHLGRAIVVSGGTLAGSVWTLNTTAPVTVDTTAQTWVNAPVRSGTYEQVLFDTTGGGAAIAAAIVAAPAAGGRVVVGPGTWDLAAVITIARSNVQIYLRKGAILRATAALAHMIKVGDGSSTFTDIQITGEGKLDGNALAGTAVRWDGPIKRLTVGKSLEVTGTVPGASPTRSGTAVDGWGSTNAGTVNNKALTSNVATLTTSSAHALVAGNVVMVGGVGAPFDGTWTVLAAPTTTTFTYAVTAANVASAAATGTAHRLAEDISYDGIYCHDCHEGVQIVRARNVKAINNRVYDMTAATGQDCIEISEVDGFIIAGNDARNPGNQNACIDIFENSSNGAVSDNVLTCTDGTPLPLGITLGHNTLPCHDVVIDRSNKIKGLFRGGVSTTVGTYACDIDPSIESITGPQGASIYQAALYIGGPTDATKRPMKIGASVGESAFWSAIIPGGAVRFEGADLANPGSSGAAITAHVLLYPNAGVVAHFAKNTRMYVTSGWATPPTYNVDELTGGPVAVVTNESTDLAGATSRPFRLLPNADVIDAITGTQWFVDASRILAFDGDAVATWTAVTGPNLVQATGAAQPIFRMANTRAASVRGVGPRPVVYFDGTDDLMAAASAITAKHFVVVARYRGATFNDYDGLLTSTTVTSILTANSGAAVFLDPSAGAATYHKNGVASAASAMQGPMNAFAIMSISNAAGWTITPQVGKDRTNAGRWWDGEIAWIRAWDHVLTAAERQTVENALAAEFGILIPS